MILDFIHKQIKALETIGRDPTDHILYLDPTLFKQLEERLTPSNGRFIPPHKRFANIITIFDILVREGRIVKWEPIIY